MLEAVYECLVKDDDELGVYESFCERIEKKKTPYLVSLDYSVFKLEIPMLAEIDHESGLENQQSTLPPIATSEQIIVPRERVLSLRERAMKNRESQPKFSAPDDKP